MLPNSRKSDFTGGTAHVETQGPHEPSDGTSRNLEQGIVFDEVSVRFDELEALQEVNLHVARGSFTAIIGPSGCGKTTLLNVVAGFITPTNGQVRVDGSPITGPGHDRAVVFQQTTALLPWLSVRQNVEFGLKLRKVRKDERRERVDYYLDRVQLTAFSSRPIYELSGGMQQRVAVARALANDAGIVLMDEPFGALDALTRETMQDFILEIWRNTQRTFVLITHSIDEALYVAESVVIMSPRPGRIVGMRAGFADVGSQSNDIKRSADFVDRRAELRELLS